MYQFVFLDEKGGEMKDFYVDIMFVNNATGNATILYDEYEKTRDRIVLIGDPYRMRAILRTTVAPNYVLKAYKMYTKQQYYLNGKETYAVQPSIGESGPMSYVYITDGRKLIVLGLFYHKFP